MKDISWATVLVTLVILIALGMLAPKLRARVTGG